MIVCSVRLNSFTPVLAFDRSKQKFLVKFLNEIMVFFSGNEALLIATRLRALSQDKDFLFFNLMMNNFHTTG